MRIARRVVAAGRINTPEIEYLKGEHFLSAIGSASHYFIYFQFCVLTANLYYLLVLTHLLLSAKHNIKASTLRCPIYSPDTGGRLYSGLFSSLCLSWLSWTFTLTSIFYPSGFKILKWSQWGLRAWVQVLSQVPLSPENYIFWYSIAPGPLAVGGVTP